MTPAVQWLIAVNVAIYFLQLTVVRPEDMWGWLAFRWSDLDHAPWTMGTYMFVHRDLWHLALNMYGLWLFGRRVEQAWSPGKFAIYYLWCGLGGVLMHLLFVHDSTPMGGASAAVLGVTLAYAMQWPDDEVLFFGIVPMKVKWMVAFFAGLDLLQGAASMALAGGGGSGVAYFAHLGGLAAGWLYMRSPSARSLERLRQRIAQIPDVPDETPRAVPRSLPRTREPSLSEADEVVAKSKAAVAKRPAPPRPMLAKDAKTAALDLVLDKISEQGMSSLTTEERRLLEEMSKKLRNS
jgi:membrane associated rhomboid family serine protease